MHPCASTNKLQVQNIRQGYDGALNMCGQLYGLKILFLQDCPSVFFLHELQLVLNAFARNVPDMQLYFQLLSSIITFVGSSSKRIYMLKDIQELEIAKHLAYKDLETRKSLN